MSYRTTVSMTSDLEARIRASIRWQDGETWSQFMRTAAIRELRARGIAVDPEISPAPMAKVMRAGQEVAVHGLVHRSRTDAPVTAAMAPKGGSRDAHANDRAIEERRSARARRSAQFASLSQPTDLPTGGLPLPSRKPEE